VPVGDGDGDVEDVEEADRVEARLPDVDVANSALMLTENEVADGRAELKDEYALLLSALERLATGLSAVAQQMLIWFVTCVHFSLGGVSNHLTRDWAPSSSLCDTQSPSPSRHRRMWTHLSSKQQNLLVHCCCAPDGPPSVPLQSTFIPV
jgi:hypothetical protein